EPNSALLPLLELCSDVFSNQHCMPRAANQLVFFRVALGSNQGENDVAIRRRDGDPAPTGFIALIDDQFESQLVHVEAQASVLIADEDIDTKDAKIRVLTLELDGALLYASTRA